MENTNGEKLERWWENRVLFTITIAGVLVGFFISMYIYIISPIFQIKTDTAVINEKLTSIEEKLDEHKTLSQKENQSLIDRILKIESKIFK